MRKAIGIDLGGTELRVGLVDEAGHVLRAERVPTDASADPAAMAARMAGLVACVTEGAGALAGLGIGTPGPLDGATGRVLAPPTLPRWRDVPLRDMLAAATGLAVTLENDGHAAARGEWRFGAGRGCADFIYLTVSTGIGGGIVSGNRLLQGRHGLAGHVGHMTLSDGSEPCACGNRGCWEALASGTALGRAARAALLRHPESAIQALAGDAPPTARHVAQAARAGDPLALELMAAEAHWLGIGIVNLLHLFSPEMVVMGGGVSEALDLLAPGIAATVRERALPGFRDVAVRRAQLGPMSGLVGAASLAFDGTADAPA